MSLRTAKAPVMASHYSYVLVSCAIEALRNILNDDTLPIAPTNLRSRYATTFDYMNSMALLTIKNPCTNSSMPVESAEEGGDWISLMIPTNTDRCLERGVCSMPNAVPPSFNRNNVARTKSPPVTTPGTQFQKGSRAFTAHVAFTSTETFGICSSWDFAASCLWFGNDVVCDLTGTVFDLTEECQWQMLRRGERLSTLTISHPFACGSIIPGPFTVRQKCCDGSEKKSSWKRTSPQIWQRWAAVSGMLCDLALLFGVL